MNTKPLGIKNYGSIGHLPCSRLGPSDSSVPEGMAIICTVSKRDKHDRIFVTEKLDGSNCGVALLDGEIIGLGRAGYLADSSPFVQHKLFADWVRYNDMRFKGLLREGERCVGEWLALGHGTRYTLRHEPFVIFDLITGKQREAWEIAEHRIKAAGFVTPALLNNGSDCMSVEAAMEACKVSHHGADEVEGAVWRVERNGVFDFMAKYVRPDKVDGKLLPEVSGEPEVWNWNPVAAPREPTSSPNLAGEHVTDGVLLSETK